MQNFDVIITGSGPNGLAAAIYLQQKGLKTAIFEKSLGPGGSVRTRELTLPGFKHDLGASILPMAIASPFFRNLPLQEHGLEWIFPEIPFSHPLKNGEALAAYQDLDKTAQQLGQDQDAYLDLIGPIVHNWEKLENDLLGPLGIPENIVDFVKFGLKALPSAKFLANHYFKNEGSKMLFYGAAAHSNLPLTNLASSSFGLVLTAMAHRYGWPFPKGGAQNFSNSLESYYRSLGGTIHYDKTIAHLEELPPSKAYVFDLTPAQLLKIKGTNFTDLFRSRLKAYNYGAGVFKIDWALSEPIPFINEKCKRSGTIHLGFSAEEMEISESKVHNNEVSEKPYVLLAQHSIFDHSRAPEGKHTAWAYIHVPNGSIRDFTQIIEDQVERAAPGFKDVILARSRMNTVQLEQWNPNLVGGDINGGKPDITQLFTRPVISASPYSTPDSRVYISSSSTPPGGGVHGMCGYPAARKVLKDHFGDLATNF